MRACVHFMWTCVNVYECMSLQRACPCQQVSHSDEDSEFFPGLAQGLEDVAVVAVAAGDSYTVALADDGRVFMTGTFRVRFVSPS